MVVCPLKLNLETRKELIHFLVPTLYSALLDGLVIAKRRNENTKIPDTWYFHWFLKTTLLTQEELLKEKVYPARDRYFAALSKFLTKSENGFLVGKSVSWVDLVISDNLQVIDGIVQIFEGYPEVKKFVDYIHTLPKLQKYLAERPPSTF